MTEPQSWVLIGVFATIMLGGMTIMTTLINRTTTAVVNGLRSEMYGAIGELRGEMNGRIDGLQGEVRGLRGEMNARFEAMGVRMDALDRDVATLFTRWMD